MQHNGLEDNGLEVPDGAKLLCNEVSHWLGAKLESALCVSREYTTQ